MPKYTYINVCITFFSIWEHIKALPSHKITVLVVRSTWSHLGGPT